MHARLERHSTVDLNAVATQLLDLRRVVGQQLDTLHTQVAQDVGGGPVLALVGLMAEHKVGVDSVVAFILQIVSAQLLRQSDAPRQHRQLTEDWVNECARLGTPQAVTALVSQQPDLPQLFYPDNPQTR